MINTLKYNLGLRKIAKRKLSSDFRTGPRFQLVRDKQSTFFLHQIEKTTQFKLFSEQQP